MKSIKIHINGFVWWFRDNHIFETEHSKVGLHIYSQQITKDERKQITNQLKIC